MNLRFAAAYIGLLLLCLFVAALVWSFAVSDVLYHCWDDVPIICFLPPFVHDVSPLANGDHDHYIAAPWVVYSVWSVLVWSALWLPWRIIHSFTAPPNHALQRTAG